MTGGDGDTCRRTVLWSCTLRHVDVDVPVFEDAVVHAQQVDMRLDVFQGDDCRLLHHVAQVTGQGKLACLALAQRGFDKENLAAHRGPCQVLLPRRHNRCPDRCRG